MKKWKNPTGHKVGGKWRMLPLYNQWFDMYQRCTSERSKRLRPTYKDVVLHPDWYSYDNYCEWAKVQKGFEEIDDQGHMFQLDKDILGGTIYSPDTCLFIPKEVNTFLVRFSESTGVSVTKHGKFRVCVYDVDLKTTRHIACFNTFEEAFLCYRTIKRERAEFLRNKWKDKIDVRAYEALSEVW